MSPSNAKAAIADVSPQLLEALNLACAASAVNADVHPSGQQARQLEFARTICTVLTAAAHAPSPALGASSAFEAKQITKQLGSEYREQALLAAEPLLSLLRCTRPELQLLALRGLATVPANWLSTTDVENGGHWRPIIDQLKCLAIQSVDSNSTSEVQEKNEILSLASHILFHLDNHVCHLILDFRCLVCKTPSN